MNKRVALKFHTRNRLFMEYMKSGRYEYYPGAIPDKSCLLDANISLIQLLLFPIMQTSWYMYVCFCLCNVY